MRLTLRTLLAYRDGVLSPTETSDLHQRIRQTEVASNLLRRVENLVKHKQLLAPKLNGEGLGGDANTVAEYLDDTLASEQVPEFERICIAESDLVLAELAHCHQLLAEAMNSQVVVPQDLRSLAISLTNPQNQAALQRRLKIGGKSAAVSGTAGSLRRLDDAHPEKLVEAVEVEAGDANGREAKVHESNVAERLQVQAPMVASGGGSINPQGLDLERPQLAHEVPEYLVGQKSGGWRIPAAIAAMVGLLVVLAWQALGPLSNVRELFVANNSTSSPSTEPASQLDTKPKSEETKPSVKRNEVGTVQSGAAPSPNPVESVDTSEGSANAALSDTVASDTALSDAATTETSPPATDLANQSFSWTPAVEDAKSVLFVRQTDGKELKRILANTPLPKNAEIIVPPAMRPTLNLAGHCSWEVCGPTRMQLSGEDKVTITTSLCRAITKCGTLGSDVTIVAPTGPINLKFADAASMAAVEVAYRPVLHGSVTDKLAYKPFLIVVAVEGQVTVTSTREATETKNIRLVVGEGVAFVDGQPIEFELGAIPSWYRAGNDPPLDVFAAADINKSIDGTADVDAQLTSLCLDIRPETAALAIQSKMLLGEWEGFAGDFLNNESMRSHWSAAIGLAAQLIASSEPASQALRTALETAHPGRGESLFTLLTGADDGSQPKEVLSKLVESLASEELDERVLAAYQLRRLMGKDFGFQPSVPNRAVLQQWRRAITSGPSFLPIDNPIWEAKKP